jgi:hypothetical protein
MNERRIKWKAIRENRTLSEVPSEEELLEQAALEPGEVILDSLSYIVTEDKNTPKIPAESKANTPKGLHIFFVPSTPSIEEESTTERAKTNTGKWEFYPQLVNKGKTELTACEPQLLATE